LARQVHSIVQEPQNFDHLIRLSSDAKENEVTPFAAGSGNVKRMQAPADIVAALHADQGWSRGQGLQRCSERFGI
jgi:hypothetical protein